MEKSSPLFGVFWTASFLLAIAFGYSEGIAHKLNQYDALLFVIAWFPWPMRWFAYGRWPMRVFSFIFAFGLAIILRTSGWV